MVEVASVERFLLWGWGMKSVVGLRARVVAVGVVALAGLFAAGCTPGATGSANFPTPVSPPISDHYSGVPTEVNYFGCSLTGGWIWASVSAIPADGNDRVIYVYDGYLGALTSQQSIGQDAWEGNVGSVSAGHCFTVAIYEFNSDEQTLDPFDYTINW
jgi:hypothetical protein